jgi:hypothetical protein
MLPPIDATKLSTFLKPPYRGLGVDLRRPEDQLPTFFRMISGFFFNLIFGLFNFGLLFFL